MRLDQALPACNPGVSRRLARRFIEIGGVHLDGRRMRQCGYTVAAVQRLELYVDGLDLEPFVLADKHLLFRDAHVLVVNKPAGIAVQPTPARYRGTLYDALQRLLAAERGGRWQPSIGMVQRLDRDTSGVMIFSIHPAAHGALTRAFHERQVEKHYLALVGGCVEPGEGRFCSQLARRRANNLTVSVDHGGRYAETHYRVRQWLPEATLVDVSPLTGRTHQIRAHFAEAGYPLLGDTTYGGRKELNGQMFSRQMLHAEQLIIPHPISGARLTFQAPVADDFLVALQQMERAIQQPVTRDKDKV
ncbi:MAG: RluA family pseudouridine synthase [Desulfuromonas sp.]|nr:MAG: RluA family pseudouridine synthase [Desulfuromonas sp.]